MRKLNAAIGRTNCAVVFTNQLRSKIGVIYGNPEVTTGGNAMKFYASLRLDIRASSDEVVACSIGAENLSIEASDSPSFSRSLVAASPSRTRIRSRLSASAWTCAKRRTWPMHSRRSSRNAARSMC